MSLAQRFQLPQPAAVVAAIGDAALDLEQRREMLDRAGRAQNRAECDRRQVARSAWQEFVAAEVAS